ncbi:hypothetical protein [Priestia endophytica]|uniref:hypothetical protein n=1 Tax=Priestia endophytica TaxID=135735 RepID=UPI001623ABCF|nr:hypothetical protein [Priestia endophytica]
MYYNYDYDYGYYGYPEPLSSYYGVPRQTPRPPRPRPPQGGTGMFYMDIDDFKAAYPIGSKIWYSGSGVSGSGTLLKISDNGTATIQTDSGALVQVTVDDISMAGTGPAPQPPGQGGGHWQGGGHGGHGGHWQGGGHGGHGGHWQGGGHGGHGGHWQGGGHGGHGGHWQGGGHGGHWQGGHQQHPWQQHGGQHGR